MKGAMHVLCDIGYYICVGERVSSEWEKRARAKEERERGCR